MHRSTVAILALAIVGFAAPTPAQATIRAVADEFDRPGNVAAGDGWMAATQAQSTRAQLFAGRLGGKLQRVPGPTYAPYWAHPHVGTDVRGKVVVVFPACLHGDCDLHMLYPESGVVRPVPGASSPGANEVEGDLDRGALAYIAEPPHRPSSSKMRLVYRAAGGAARTLNHFGGEDVNLDRGRILTQRADHADEHDDCASRVVDLTTAGGARTEIARVTCGADGQQTVVGVGFAGKQRIAWGVAGTENSTFFERDAAAGSSVRSVVSLHQFIAFSPVSSTRGLIVAGPIDYATGPDPDGEPGFPLFDVSGIHLGDATGTAQLH